MQEYINKATKQQKNSFTSVVPVHHLAGGSGSAGAGASGGERVQAPISCTLQVVNQSFDTLVISLDISNQNAILPARMEAAKRELQSSSTAQEQAFKFTESGTAFNWNIQRTGVKNYPYVFRSADLTMCMSNRKAGSQIPNMQLRIGSISCNEDLENLMRMLRFWLACIGIQIHEEKATRVDICADLTYDIKKGMVDRQSRYITQARNVSLHYTNRKFTGIVFGRGQVVARIYDKIAEMNEKQDLEKSMFFHHKWGVPQGTPITRVEFQLRRQAIKEFFKGKTDLTVLLRRQGDLWQYLTEKWLRHCSKFVDRDNKNQGKAENSLFWQVVRGAFKNLVKPLKRKRTRAHINIPALRKQASGILTTIAAALGLHSSVPWDILSTLRDIVTEDIKERMDHPNFSEIFLSKQVRAVACF